MTGNTSYSPQSSQRKRKWGQEQALKIAEQISARLVNSAIWHEDRCTWTGDDMQYRDDSWQVVHGTLDPYLYSGTAGIAVFLARSYQMFGQEELKRTARGAALQTQALLKEGQPPGFGLYSGITGIALAHLLTGTLIEDAQLLETGEQMVSDIIRHIDQGNLTREFDLIAGLTGNIIGLLQISDILQEKALLTSCEKLGDLLLEQAITTRNGLYWCDNNLTTRGNIGLCGLGHGASGAALAFMELGHRLDRAEYLEAAKEAMRYEWSWFNPAQSNWPDIRDLEEEQPQKSEVSEFPYPVFWCHGAAGIGLVRLWYYQQTQEAIALAEATAALQAATLHAKQMLDMTRKYRQLPYGENMSLCHGLGSIIDLFVFASQVLDNPVFYNRALDIGAIGARVAHRTRGRWQCGIQDGDETPGLMLGLSGIGFSYLQLAAPDRFSQIGLFLSR